MDFRKYALLSVACIAVLHRVEAGCKEDLENNDEFKECKRAYMTYMAGLGDSGGDPTKMMTAFCSQEGQAATACLQPHIKACNELTADPIFTIFGAIGGNGCPPGMGGEGGASAECQAAMGECMGMSMGGATAEDANKENAPTKFHDFQEAVKTICGDVKGQFDCLKKHEKKCPGLETQYKQMYEMGRQQTAPGEPFPEFDDQKKFVMDECPKFPADFDTNTCVKENLMKTEFTECYTNATGKNGEQMTCDEYKAAYPCVTTALETCGDKYKSTFTATVNFYLGALFEDCKVVLKTKDTSSANVYTSSVSTILAGIFMALSCLIAF